MFWWDSLNISNPLDIDASSVVFVPLGEFSANCELLKSMFCSIFLGLLSFCFALPGLEEVILFLLSFLSIEYCRKLGSAIRLATYTFVCLPNVYSNRVSLICLLFRGELRTKFEVCGTTERLLGVKSARFFTSDDFVSLLVFLY